MPSSSIQASMERVLTAVDPPWSMKLTWPSLHRQVIRTVASLEAWRKAPIRLMIARSISQVSGALASALATACWQDTSTCWPWPVTARWVWAIRAPPAPAAAPWR